MVDVDRIIIHAPRLPVCLIAISLLSLAASSSAEEVLYEQKLEPNRLPILVPATVGNKACIFEFDTGAGMAFVDPALRTLLGARRASKKVDSFGRFTEVEVFDAPAIRVGAWSLPPSRVGVTDTTHSRTHYGVDIRGYMGVNALKDCSLSLDFDSGRMRILKRDGKDLPGMENLRLKFASDSEPIVKCDLEGKSMEFLIDTGATIYLGLRHEAFVAMAANGMIETNGGRKIGAETGAGRMVHLTGHFTRGQLLGVDLRDVPVDDMNATSVIGLGFLSNFNSVIDLKGGRFFYHRRTHLPPINQGAFPDIGIAFPGGRNAVYRVDPGGPMASAGLKVGDHIVRLGPLQEAEINAFSIDKLCVEHAGEKLEMRVQRWGEDKATVLNLKLPAKEFLRGPPTSQGQ